MNSEQAYKLTKKEADFLAVAQFDADLTYKEMAKKYNLGERSIRKILEKLSRVGLLKKTVFIDPFKAGLKTILLYFSIRGGSNQQREQLLKSMIKTPSITWLAELGGDYQYGCAFQTSNFNTVKQALASITRLHSGIIREKTVLSYNGLTLLPRGFFSKHVTKKYYSCCEVPNARIRDNTDLSILSLLSSNGTISGRAIGAKLGISHTTVENRISQMANDGLILGSYYRLAARKLGCHTFKFLISLRKFDRDSEVEFYKFLVTHPMINCIIETVGNWDLEVGVDSILSSEVPALAYEIHEKFDILIAAIKVIPVFEVHKFIQLSLP